MKIPSICIRAMLLVVKAVVMAIQWVTFGAGVCPMVDNRCIVEAQNSEVLMHLSEVCGGDRLL